MHILKVLFSLCFYLHYFTFSILVIVISWTTDFKPLTISSLIFLLVFKLCIIHLNLGLSILVYDLCFLNDLILKHLIALHVWTVICRLNQDQVFLFLNKLALRHHNIRLCLQWLLCACHLCVKWLISDLSLGTVRRTSIIGTIRRQFSASVGLQHLHVVLLDLDLRLSNEHHV